MKNSASETDGCRICNCRHGTMHNPMWCNPYASRKYLSLFFFTRNWIMQVQLEAGHSTQSTEYDRKFWCWRQAHCCSGNIDFFVAPCRWNSPSYLSFSLTPCRQTLTDKAMRRITAVRMHVHVVLSILNVHPHTLTRPDFFTQVFSIPYICYRTHAPRFIDPVNFFVMFHARTCTDPMVLAVTASSRSTATLAV